MSLEELRKDLYVRREGADEVGLFEVGLARKTYRRKEKKKKHTSPSIGKHVRINEMFKKKKADDEAKIIEEEAAVKAREDENAKDNEDDDTTSNENTDEEAVKAKAYEIAIRRAKLLAELEAINKEAEEPEKEKKTKNRESLHHHSKDAEENKIDNEEDDNENKTDIKENAEETDDEDQVFSKIKTMPFLNNPKRTKKKEYGKESPRKFTRGKAKKQAEIDKLNKESEEKDDEDVMSTSNEDEKEEIIDEEKKKERNSMKMKEKENDKENVSEKDGNENDDDIVDSMEVDDPNEKMKEKEADKEKEKYLFSMQGEELYFVFETKDGATTIREYMQTLAPQLKVKSNVIDTFSLVLNHEQKMNSTGKKDKYFFHTSMITKDMFKLKKENGKYDEEKQFKAFAKTIESEFKKDTEMKNMKDMEIKKMFFMYLEKVKHPRAKNVMNKKPTIIRPKWGKKRMTHIVGIFLMMHIENYNGETAKKRNLGFKKENKGNTLDIIKMRMRGTWYTGEPLWGCSELCGYLVIEGLLQIAPLSHATYPERKCFPTGILV
nr:hypothetical protein [Tanacetum cinerariifolium]